MTADIGSAVLAAFGQAAGDPGRFRSTKKRTIQG